MKKILFVLPLLFLFSEAFAQHDLTGISISVYPEKPVIGDSVKVNFAVYYVRSRHLINIDTSFSKDTLFISVCSKTSMSMSGIKFDGNYNLGKLDTGAYTVKITAYASYFQADSCEYHYDSSKIFTFHVSVPASVHQANKAVTTIFIYPNPSSTNQRLLFKLPSSTEAKIELYDMQGRMILPVYEGMLKQGEESIPVDLNSLPAGIYFYRIDIGDEVDWIKAVKLN